MRNIALCGVAGGLLTLLATTCAADEISNGLAQCRSGQLAPGLYYLTPNEKIDLPEKGSVTLPYNAQGKLLVVPELEDDEKEAAWGLTVRTVLERPDTRQEVNLSRTKVESECLNSFRRDRKKAWDDDNDTGEKVNYADYEVNLEDYVNDKSGKLTKWHFKVKRKSSCRSTRELALSYQEGKRARVTGVIGGNSAIGAVGEPRKPSGERLSSALVFRSRSKEFTGCHSMWVSKFGGTSSEKPNTSIISVSALRSKRLTMSLKITWKVD